MKDIIRVSLPYLNLRSRSRLQLRVEKISRAKRGFFMPLLEAARGFSIVSSNKEVMPLFYIFHQESLKLELVFVKVSTWMLRLSLGSSLSRNEFNLLQGKMRRPQPTSERAKISTLAVAGPNALTVRFFRLRRWKSSRSTCSSMSVELWIRR